MKNRKAIKLLNKLIDDVERNGIITNTIVEDLKSLRPYAVEEQQPLLAKTIRLLFEHIETYDKFDIPIPEEEPIEGFEEETSTTEDFDPSESMLYVLNLIAEPDNKGNKQDLRGYVASLQAYAEEN
ncbi:hypothetical protein SAMN05216480_106102 [Pustulibacterium marinum]|uniref:Uncharacterized protein n=1 Tax=Pustulibacterium marinum TaxID=1224947 RepID=A0A1I7GYM5_9FLAO|nr:hypothetical protein [Pustulibacterium marinum]SFU53532.1 hypothetical protein SAMN05216480_106102 [Pustulibacterium marinum]